MSFLNLENKTIVVLGVANRRSVAWAIAKELKLQGANLIYLFKDQSLLDKNRPLIGDDAHAFICNVEDENHIQTLKQRIETVAPVVHGLVHSIAFANYSEGLKPFHQTVKKDFLQAVDISCFSLVNVTQALETILAPDASIITISISTTKMASENYGYMGPIKAALDSTIVFLAKALAQNVSPRIRVNAVGPGLLKTSASAGIPGYIDAYLFAEKVIPRHEAVSTEEVANTAVFLLSQRSSGINAQTIVVDAAMSTNYFDRDIIHSVTKP